jgi:hypothetical protein
MQRTVLRVEAGWHHRHLCPVTTAIDLDPEVDPARLGLRDRAGKRPAPVPLQARRRADGLVELSWIVAELEPHQTVAYDLELLESPPHRDAVKLAERSDSQLTVRVHGEHVTTYHFGPEVVRPYLYPVLARGQVGVTRNWPMVADVRGETHDHPHHKGIYTAQGSVNGVDNWSEEPGHGWQIHRDFARLYEGPVAGGFTEVLDWTDADRQTNMTEKRHMVFYDTPSRLRLIDYGVTLRASHGEVTLGDTKEGGLLSVRVASSMDAAGGPLGGRFQNSVGSFLEEEAWGKRASWCDYTGPTKAGWRGVCFMDHMDNPRYPTHWHVRNYGLMTANCIGLHDFTGDPSQRDDLVIPEGESRSWTWRIVVHDGDAQVAQLAERYQDFVHPPKVVVERR